MNKRKIRILLILLIVTIVLIMGFWSLYHFTLTPDSRANKLMSNISKGKLSDSLGEILYLGDYTLLFYNKILKDANSNDEYNRMINDGYEMFFDVFFEIPQNVISYEFIKKYKSVFRPWIIQDISEEVYNNYWKNVFGNYQEFVDYNISLYKNKPNFKYNVDMEKIIYMGDEIPQISYYYKVISFNSIKRVQLIYVKTGNILQSDTWRIGAILTSEI